MTKRLKIWLIVLFTALCAAFTFAGCGIGKPSLEEVIDGYDCHVTYYGNGGYFNGSNAINVKSLYFASGEGGIPFFDIPSSGSYRVEMTGYDLVGWFLPATYQEGEHKGEVMYTYTPEGSSEAVPVYPVLDEDGNRVTDSTSRRPVFAREGVDEQLLERQVQVIASDTQVTSETKVNSGDELIVCAKWVRTLQLEYVLVYDEGKTLTGADGKEYKNGDVIKTENFIGNSMSPSSRIPMEFGGATFVNTYLDEDCTQPPAPITRPSDENVRSVTVYSKYIEGEWTLITSQNVREMFSGINNAENRFYVTEDIDCSNMGAFTPRTISSANAQVMSAKAVIEGAGHTISNVSFSVTSTFNGNAYSIFGDLSESASISNLTLDGVTLNVSGRQSEINVYTIFNSVAEGAVVENFSVGNITLNVGVPGLINGNFTTNINGVNSQTWLFGGAASDQEFLAAHAGVTLFGTNKINKV